MTTVIILGHLGVDPEVRMTPNGQKLTTLRVAQNIYQNGKEETIWWRLTVWGDDFKGMMEWLKKGSYVHVVAEMRTKPEIYTDKAGVQQVSLSATVVSLKFANSGRSDKTGQDQQQRPGTNAGAAPANQARSGVSAKEPGFLPGNNNANAMPQYNYGSAAPAGNEMEEEEMPF